MISCEIVKNNKCTLAAIVIDYAWTIVLTFYSGLDFKMELACVFFGTIVMVFTIAGVYYSQKKRRTLL